MTRLIFPIFFLISYNLISQSVISSSGNSNSSDDYTISWTIGELAISTINNSDITLTQGFHQPLIVDVIPTGIESSFL